MPVLACFTHQVYPSGSLLFAKDDGLTMRGGSEHPGVWSFVHAGQRLRQPRPPTRETKRDAQVKKKADALSLLLT